MDDRVAAGARHGATSPATRPCSCACTPSASPATCSPRAAATAAPSSTRRWPSSRREGRGVLVYMRQEGRGIGLAQQAPRLRAAGPGQGHGRGQSRPRIRRRSAPLRHRRPDPARPRREEPPHTSRTTRRRSSASRATASRWWSACPSRFPPPRPTGATSRPSARSSATSSPRSRTDVAGRAPAPSAAPGPPAAARRGALRGASPPLQRGDLKKLLDGAVEALAAHGRVRPRRVEVHWVPGSFELALAAHALAGDRPLSPAIVCVGVVIRGRPRTSSTCPRAAAQGITPRRARDRRAHQLRGDHRAHRGASLGAGGRLGRQSRRRSRAGRPSRWRNSCAPPTRAAGGGPRRGEGSRGGQAPEVARAGAPAPVPARRAGRGQSGAASRRVLDRGIPSIRTCASSRRRWCAAPSCTRRRSTSSSHHTPRTGSSTGWRWWTATSSGRDLRAPLDGRSPRRRSSSTRPSRSPRNSARRNRAASSTASSTACTKSFGRPLVPVPIQGRAIRYAILSDVHGNLEALDRRARRRRPRGRPSRSAVPRRPRGLRRRSRRLRGRARRARASPPVARQSRARRPRTPRVSTGSIPSARAATLWTRDALHADRRAVPGRRCRSRAMVEEATLVHASPRHPDEWDYLVSEEDGLRGLRRLRRPALCFVGHSHWPGRVVARLERPRPRGPLSRPGRSRVRARGRAALRHQCRQRGAAARPRPARGLCALGPRTTRTVTIRRVAYDLHAAARRRSSRAGLPRAARRSARPWASDRLALPRAGRPAAPLPPRGLAACSARWPSPARIGRLLRAGSGSLPALVLAPGTRRRARALARRLARRAPCSSSCSSAGSITPSCTSARSRGRSTWLPIAALAAYCGLYVALTAAAVAWLAQPDRRGGRARRWCRRSGWRGSGCAGWLLGGFPWGLLGYSQHAVAAGDPDRRAGRRLRRVLPDRRRERGARRRSSRLGWRRAAPGSSPSPALVLVGSLGVRLDRAPAAEARPRRRGAGRPSSSPSIEQTLKWDPAEHARDPRHATRRLTREAAPGRRARRSILWPETAATIFLRGDPALLDAAHAARPASSARRSWSGSIDRQEGPAGSS